MQTCEVLADYQEALLELLYEADSPQEVLFHLKHDPVFEPFASYVETFEPRMIEVAIELVQKWGKKDRAVRDLWSVGFDHSPT